MQFFKRSIIALTVFISLVTFVQAETSWITKKKDKTTKIENTKKKNTSWIKKKTKEDKKKYKKEEKKISKEVKSWITKKTKDEYISNIDKLPSNAIYFTGSNNDQSLLIYGYLLPDTNSEMLGGLL